MSDDGIADYDGSEWVPPLTTNAVTLLAYTHSQAVTAIGRDREVCRVCRELYPCSTYSLAVEVLGRRHVKFPS